MRPLSGWIANRPYQRSLDLLIARQGLSAVGVALLALYLGYTWLQGTQFAFGAGWSWSGVCYLAVVLASEEVMLLATGFTQVRIYGGAALGP
jgi:hypothetical protein